MVTGLLPGQNTLPRHLYIMVLTDSPLYRKCRAENRTSAPVLWTSEALATLNRRFGTPRMLEI